MNSSEVVTKKIKMLREMNNYTQQYVADELEISQNAYSLLEKGITKLSLERLDRIAEFYKVPLAELFTDIDASPTGMIKPTTGIHSNVPPAVSPLEKILYEKTIQHLENNISKLYGLIEQLTSSIPKPEQSLPPSKSAQSTDGDDNGLDNSVSK